jgi:hypothetical protein
MRKPRIFIASSVESLDVADAINVNLDHHAEVTVWKNGFKLSSSTIDSLLEKAETVDFAIFIFTPDDVATIRDQSKNVVRDNVLFELGLFTGALGKERCFIVKPREVELHFPTDLLGLTPADYDGKRSDGDLASAVNHPCVLIKKAVSELGLVSQDLEIQKRRRKKSGSNYKVGDIEHRLLARALESYMSSPNGVSAWSIFNDLNDIDNPLLVLASIKLERLGYLDKGIDEDMNHEEFYTFTITADGIDYLLENERLLERSNSKAPTRVSALDCDDDIPF